MWVCPVGFCVSSCVFTKVCKVDEGWFDLQNSTYLESGTREDNKLRWVQVKLQHEVIAQAVLQLENKGMNHNFFFL